VCQSVTDGDTHGGGEGDARREEGKGFDRVWRFYHAFLDFRAYARKYA